MKTDQGLREALEALHPCADAREWLHANRDKDEGKVRWVEGIKIHWDYSDDIPECTKERISKTKQMLENLGLELHAWYMGRAEYIIVSELPSNSFSKRYRINAEFSKVDGSWLTMEES